MAFFDRPAGDDVGSEEEQQARARIEAGGIPLEAERRLRALGEAEGPFTSTLSVAEFAVLHGGGPMPLGQVLGASVHQVGWQYLPWPDAWNGELFCELDQVAHAWDQARRRAFDRLAEEAELVGADAVLGVKIRRGEHDWARSTVDYVVSGTGVHVPGSPTASWPVLTDLSAQQYWQLQQAGWTPAGLVAATAVYFVSPSTRTRWTRIATAQRNQELEDFTRCFQAARDTVVRYLRSQADAARADGIIGVELEHRVSRETFELESAYATTWGDPGPGSSGRGGWGFLTRPSRGSDQKRSGIAVTIQAVGTAIRRQSAATSFPPETTLEARA